MQVVGTLAARCPVCSSNNLEAGVDRHFEGVVIRCRKCRFDDFVANPFGDIRILLDIPKNWCLVYAPPTPIEW